MCNVEVLLPVDRVAGHSFSLQYSAVCILTVLGLDDQ